MNLKAVVGSSKGSYVREYKEGNWTLTVNEHVLEQTQGALHLNNS